MYTPNVYDHDLIKIGAGTVIEGEVLLTPHRREGRDQRYAPLHIGRGCVLRTHCVAMFHVEMEDSTVLEPLSLAMPGQTLRYAMVYKGVPCVAVGKSIHSSLRRRVNLSDSTSSSSSNSTTRSSAALLVPPLQIASSGKGKQPVDVIPDI